MNNCSFPPPAQKECYWQHALFLSHLDTEYISILNTNNVNDTEYISILNTNNVN